MNEIVLNVEGLMCGGCEKRVETALSKFKEIKKVKANHKDGIVKVDMNVENESIWMSQEQMAKLYDTTKNNISMHLKNIFAEGELSIDSVVKKILTTANDGKKYNVLHIIFI